MRFKNIVTAAASCAFFFALVSTAKADSWSGKELFPEQNCNVAKAVKALRQKNSSNEIKPLGGDLPWPGVLGVWTNLSRGIYFEVRAHETSKNTWIAVDVKSLCSNDYLASGSRTLRASDWDRSYLKLQVTNYGLSCHKDALNLSIRATTNLGNTTFLDVKFEGEASGSGSSGKPMDRFIASAL